ncbi:partial molybdopterin synthase catalytic subunit, partial [Rhodocyclaceae bacterium]
MSISVQEADFDVGAEIEALSADDGGAGAVASFVGLVRGDADGVSAMTLEHYPGMTEKALVEIVAEARERWQLRRVRVIHRYGRLLPGARIVFVGVSSSHRGDAFAACEFVMDYLKTRA